MERSGGSARPERRRSAAPLGLAPACAAVVLAAAACDQGIVLEVTVVGDALGSAAHELEATMTVSLDTASGPDGLSRDYAAGAFFPAGELLSEHALLLPDDVAAVTAKVELSHEGLVASLGAATFANFHGSGRYAMEIVLPAPCDEHALSFGGIQYVDVPHADALTPSGAITIEAWVSWTPSDPDVQEDILSHGDPDLNLGYLLTILNRELRLVLWDGTTSSLAAGGSPFPQGGWHHVAGTYDGAAIRTFIDGELVAEVPEAGLTIAPYLGFLRMGGSANCGCYRFEGLIDEVRLSSFARYTADFVPPTDRFQMAAETIALYHFDEAGQTVRDESGSHDGTLGADADVADDDPSLVAAPCICVRPMD